MMDNDPFWDAGAKQGGGLSSLIKVGAASKTQEEPAKVKTADGAEWIRGADGCYRRAYAGARANGVETT